MSPVRLAVMAGLVTAAAYAPGAGRSLSYDGAETVAYFVLPGSALDPLRSQRTFNNHPLFSVLEHLVVDVVGSAEEAVLRVLPILCGAATVAVVTWAAGRRWGSLAGLSAGALTASNPLFLATARAVRGYSLVALLAVVATLAIIGLRTDLSARRRAGYVAAGAGALLTHLAVGVLVIGHLAAGSVWRERARRAAWTTVAGAMAVAAVLYLRLLKEMVSSSGDRGYRFQVDFPADLAWEVLGGTWVGQVAVGLLVLAGASLVRRRDAWVGAAAVVAALVVVWVVGPTDLTPRFFVWTVPLTALVAARAVARWPRAGAAAVLVTVAAAVVHVVPGYTESENPYPEAAALVDELAESGQRVCVPNLSVPPLLAYTDRFDPVTSAGGFEGCDLVVVSAPGLDPQLEEAARARFPEVEVIPAPKPALVLRPAGR